MTDLTSQITTDATKAKRLKSGDMERDSHSLPDLIKADEYLASKTATRSISKTLKGIINVMNPPGGA